MEKTKQSKTKEKRKNIVIKLIAIVTSIWSTKVEWCIMFHHYQSLHWGCL